MVRFGKNVFGSSPYVVSASSDLELNFQIKWMGVDAKSVLVTTGVNHLPYESRDRRFMPPDNF